MGPDINEEKKRKMEMMKKIMTKKPSVSVMAIDIESKPMEKKMEHDMDHEMEGKMDGEKAIKMMQEIDKIKQKYFKEQGYEEDKGPGGIKVNPEKLLRSSKFSKLLGGDYQ